MPEHTPGPWEVEYDGEAHIIRMGTALARSSSHAVQHAIVYDHGLAPLEHEDDPETVQFREAEANARLIAAAPEFLAAAKLIMKADFQRGWPQLFNPLADAIAKAEGREP